MFVISSKSANIKLVTKTRNSPFVHIITIKCLIICVVLLKNSFLLYFCANMKLLINKTYPILFKKIVVLHKYSKKDTGSIKLKKCICFPVSV